MNSSSVNGVTVKVIRDIRKRDSEGLCPLRIRVTFARDARFYSTGYMLDEVDWQKLEKAKSKELKIIRESVDKMFGVIEGHVKELAETNTFSFATLNKRLARSTGDLINTAYTLKIKALYQEGKISTSELYKNSLRHLEIYGGERIKFQTVSVDWLKGFERHLLKLKKAYTTVSMIIRTLRTIVNEAKSSGIVKDVDYPFGQGKYIIPESTGRAMALTLQQIGQIVRHECQNTIMERCRDLWVFSYLCNGANITDIAKLKYSNIANEEIYFYRQKTLGKGKMSEIRATLTPKIQEIIDQWGNEKRSKDTFIFNILDGNETPADERRKIKNFTRHINEYMGKIATSLDMPKISTYHARHSYATVLKRSGANISFISESLGHSNLKTTENYLAKFESEERTKNAMLLTNF